MPFSRAFLAISSPTNLAASLFPVFDTLPFTEVSMLEAAIKVFPVTSSMICA